MTMSWLPPWGADLSGPSRPYSEQAPRIPSRVVAKGALALSGLDVVCCWCFAFGALVCPNFLFDPRAPSCDQLVYLEGTPLVGGQSNARLPRPPNSFDTTPAGMRPPRAQLCLDCRRTRHTTPHRMRIMSLYVDGVQRCASLVPAFAPQEGFAQPGAATPGGPSPTCCRICRHHRLVKVSYIPLYWFGAYGCRSYRLYRFMAYIRLGRGRSSVTPDDIIAGKLFIVPLYLMYNDTL